MFPMPWHPVLVHFPLVLAMILPFAALAALVIGFRSNPGGKGRKYWSITVLLLALLAGSSFLAVRTGQGDEEKVEKVLASEAPLETHEEMGERLMQAAMGVLLVAALGLAPGALGLGGRVAATAGSFAILFLGLQAGHTGGRLVYQHGAGAAYAAGQQAGTAEEKTASESGSARKGGERGGTEED